MNHSPNDRSDAAISPIEAHSTSSAATVYISHGGILLHSKSTVASLLPSIIIHTL